MIIIPKVTGLFLTIYALFYFFTYTACYLYQELKFPLTYFNTILYSIFTMLQIMTLDGWGQIGRDIALRQDYISSLWLVLFIFILFFFFWNVLIGVILEIFIELREEKEHKKDLDSYLSLQDNIQNNQVNLHSNQQSQTNLDQPPQMQLNKNNSNKFQHTCNFNHLGHMEQSLVKAKSHQQHEQLKRRNSNEYNNQNPLQNPLFTKQSILEGDFYQYYILVIWFLCQGMNMNDTQIQQKINMFDIGRAFFWSSLYTIHTLVLLNDKQWDTSQIKLFILHFLSGPGALIADIFSYSVFGFVGFSGILHTLKVMTIPSIKLILLSSLSVIPILLPPFTSILGLTFLMGLWGVSFMSTFGDSLGKYWKDYETSVYSFIQVLTLDDWSARFTKLLYDQGNIFYPDVFIIFIFLGNFFFLNIMIAFSSQCFAIEEEDQIKVDFYVKQDNNQICQADQQNQDEECLQNTDTVANFQDLKNLFGQLQKIQNREENFLKELKNYLHVSGTTAIKLNFQGVECTIRASDLFIQSL